MGTGYGSLVCLLRRTVPPLADHNLQFKTFPIPTILRRGHFSYNAHGR